MTRSSGTFISGECSLGYDVSHEKIEAALIKAAKAAGLQDPFVHVTTLGDFSVVYKVHGLLKDVKRILTAKSNLYKMILDCLHEADIEIVSPNFMNQRQVGDAVFIPKKELKKIPEKKQTQSPEDLIFDKADQAENLEFKKKRLTELEPKLEELDEQLKTAETEEAKAAVQGKIDQLVSLRERMQKSIEEEVSKLDKRSK